MAGLSREGMGTRSHLLSYGVPFGPSPSPYEPTSAEKQLATKELTAATLRLKDRGGPPNRIVPAHRPLFHGKTVFKRKKSLNLTLLRLNKYNECYNHKDIRSQRLFCIPGRDLGNYTPFVGDWNRKVLCRSFWFDFVRCLDIIVINSEIQRWISTAPQRKGAARRGSGASPGKGQS